MAQTAFVEPCEKRAFLVRQQGAVLVEQGFGGGPVTKSKQHSGQHFYRCWPLVVVRVLGKETFERGPRRGSVGVRGLVGHHAKVGISTRIVASIKDRRTRGGRDRYGRGWGVRVRRSTAGQKNHAPSGKAHEGFLRYSERTVDGEQSNRCFLSGWLLSGCFLSD
jgi:hypothetical protein